MTNLLVSLTCLIFMCSLCFAVDTTKADKLSLKYCKEQFLDMGSYSEKDSRVVHKKMYIDRMLQLNDPKLNAYFAKDEINQSISMYEYFLSTGKEWKNSDISDRNKKEFPILIDKLKQDLAVINRSYPTNFKIFDKIDAESPIPNVILPTDK